MWGMFLMQLTVVLARQLSGAHALHLTEHVPLKTLASSTPLLALVAQPLPVGSDVPWALLLGVGIIGLIGAFALALLPGPDNRSRGGIMDAGSELCQVSLMLVALLFGFSSCVFLFLALAGGMHEWGALFLLLTGVGAGLAACFVPCLYHTAKQGAEVPVDWSKSDV